MQIVKPGELGARETEAWRELRAKSGAQSAAQSGAQSGAHDNPFMGPEFARAVAAVRPRARVAVWWERGEPVGFFPYEKGPFGHGRAIGLGVSDCQGAVLRPGLRPDPRALLRVCGLSAWEFDNLEAGQDVFQGAAAESFGSPVIDIGEGYAAYEALLRTQSPKFLKTTLAKERRLGRQVGEVRFVFDERDPAALRTLMEWKSAQYRRTGRRDRFAKEWISTLVRRLHELRAPGCSGVLSVLYAGERPVAAHFGLRSPTVLSCWFPAYDPEFAKFSPGLVLHLRMAEAAAAAGIGMLDLGRGAAEYKDALKTGELTVYEGSVTRPGVRAGLYWLSREPSRRAHSFVRNRPALAARGRRTLNRLARLRAAGR
ncbi:GNAT family N-acetyltransferase [Streptomyces vilmorinianum]|uniref:GNAT family N-acetyltransferase n=1 Tax=Streptomyces vilmorinianum TaxID=3051092 RepID=UPI0020C7641F|nr:GNAT family N-acetyltransferase [Streptomyces vilmorinianum]